MTVSDMCILIAALAAAVVSVVNAVRIPKKLDQIHRDTNGSMTALKMELRASQAALRRERER